MSAGRDYRQRRISAGHTFNEAIDGVIQNNPKARTNAKALARLDGSTDHASLVKFIERNWHLKPLTNHSRDNLPNPIHKHDAYVPDNMLAIGDLFDMFDFGHEHDD